MFKRIRTVLGINVALSQLGINTQDLNPVWRRGCQEIALNQGLSSKAVAAYMYYQLPWAVRPTDGVARIERWVAEGDISRAEADYAKGSEI